MRTLLQPRRDIKVNGPPLEEGGPAKASCSRGTSGCCTMPDGNVVPFRSKQRQRLERTADEVIDLLSPEARLLALAELIEEKQGFGWLLAEDLVNEAS